MVILDKDPIKAAEAVYNKQIENLIWECEAVLTATHKKYNSPLLSQLVTIVKNPDNPWVKWCSLSTLNYRWLWNYAKALTYEYEKAFSERTGQLENIALLGACPHSKLNRITPWPVDSPSDFIYEQRVLHVSENAHLFGYVKRKEPSWYDDFYTSVLLDNTSI